MANSIKSGKEILDDFFENIQKIENVDTKIAETIETLYRQNKLTDANLKNSLEQLRRDHNGKN